MERKATPRFKLAVMGLLLLIPFRHRIEQLLHTLIAVVFVAIAAMTALRHGVGLCKRITKNLRDHALQFALHYMHSISLNLRANIPPEWLQSIADHWNGGRSNAYSLATFIANDIRETIAEIPVMITWVCETLSAWLGWNIPKKDDCQNESSRDPFNRRVLLVVSVKSSRSYEATKSALSGLDDDAPCIDWEDNKTDSLPEPSSFVRHFAICAISIDDWNDNRLTLLRKFRDGTFWELLGPDVLPREGDAVHWRRDKIESIDGVVSIGHITFTNEDISEQFYRPLKNAWQIYDPIWWNGCDFTARLAYMIMPEKEARQSIVRYVVAVLNSRINKAYQAHDRVNSRGCLIGFGGMWACAVGGGCAQLLAVSAAAAAAPVAAVGGFALAMGSVITSVWKDGQLSGEYTRWIERSKDLERKFPILGDLFEYK